MKKKSILNLIKYYSENNDSAFRNEAYEIARDFDASGDYQLSEYIVATLANANTFSPQLYNSDLKFFDKLEQSFEPLPLPEPIQKDIIGIINAVNHNIGINKFLFQGAPGTGKTESVKQVARLLNREVFCVNFDKVIDSKLGQTSKNISLVFEEVNSLSHPEKVLILFDEIDALALDRTSFNDIREMGRATSSVLKGFDSLHQSIVLVATTNLFDNFDKAILRRFDYIVDFNRYNQEDLKQIAEIILDYYLTQFKEAGKNIKLFRKIIALSSSLPYPGELKNIIKTSLAFASKGKYDYLKNLYSKFTNGKDIPSDCKILKKQKFTVREIECLTGVSKSSVSRELQEKR